MSLTLGNIRIRKILFWVIPAFTFFLFLLRLVLSIFPYYQNLFFRKESNTLDLMLHVTEVILHVSRSSYLKVKMLKCSHH